MSISRPSAVSGNWVRHMVPTLISLAVLGLITGCAILPRDHEAFEAMVVERVPIGTAEAEARASMKELGLACSIMEDEWFQDEDDRLLFCTRSPWAFPLPLIEIEWRAVFDIVEGRVTEQQGFVFYTGP